MAAGGRLEPGDDAREHGVASGYTCRRRIQVASQIYDRMSCSCKTYSYNSDTVSHTPRALIFHDNTQLQHAGHDENARLITALDNFTIKLSAVR